MRWGEQNEGGVWIAPSSQWRWMWRGHDALYVAAGRVRLRIMKPFQPYFSEWLVQKYFSWWTPVICVGIIVLLWWQP